MRLEHYSPLPSYRPRIPLRLREMLTAYLPNAERIDIQHHHGRGWSKFNALYPEGEADVDRVAEEIMSLGDSHAEHAERTGKYRALVWRRNGGELERRSVRFTSEYITPEQRMRAARWRRAKDPMRALVDAQERLIECMEWHGRQRARQVAEFDRLEALHGATVRSIESDLRLLLEDGLAMQGQAVRELGEARIQEALRKLEQGNARRAWEVLEPLVRLAIEVAVGRVAPSSTARVEIPQPAPVEPTADPTGDSE